MDSGYLRYIFAGAATLAGTALLIVLLASIRTEGNAKKQRRIDISKLAPDRFFTIDTDTLRYFVIRPHDGDVYVLAVPVDENTIPMPENFWWQPLMRCKDFVLGAYDGVIANNTRFHCRDPGQPQEWAARWQWDLRGRHVPDADSKVSDLYRVRIERSHDEIILLSLETD